MATGGVSHGYCGVSHGYWWGLPWLLAGYHMVTGGISHGYRWGITWLLAGYHTGDKSICETAPNVHACYPEGK